MSERDPRVDAAWRSANRDEPPAALDEAIRAAARRAVESGPRHRRDKHWWYPLAAAATVAVIAVGLLQMTPPERVTPTISDAPKLAKQEAAAPAAVQPPATSDSSAQPSNEFAAKPPAVAKKDAAFDERARLAGALQNERKPQRELEATDKLAPAPARASAQNAAVPGAPPAEMARRSEPFPAEKPEIAARRDAAVAEEQSKGASVATEPVAPSSKVPPLPAAAPPAAATSGAASGVAGGTLLQKRAQSESGLAKETDEAAPKSKTAPRSVEDWVKLIRQLRSEGRTEEATKEIAAFRSAYGERADSLLPPDLRSPAQAAPGNVK